MVPRRIILTILCTLYVFASFRPLTAIFMIKVDHSGKGDHQKIQDAIDAVPFENSKHVLTLVKQGIYREKIVVPSNKSFIILSGIKSSTSIITWNDCGNIFESPTLTVLASDFIARYLTIRNTHGPGAKAVALRVSGDRAAFFGCRIISHQDTLLDDKGRHYYSNYYIEGDTHFVYGNAASIFKRCHLHSVSEGKGADYITAQHREWAAQETGFIFVGCKASGRKSALLGRPWGAYSRVVFALTYMSNAILPQGWDDWGDSSKHRCKFLQEGSMAAQSITPEEARPYLNFSIIGGRSWIRSAITRLKVSITGISNYGDIYYPGNA